MICLPPGDFSAAETRSLTPQPRPARKTRHEAIFVKNHRPWDGIGAQLLGLDALR